MYQSDYLNILSERGFIQAVTNPKALDDKMCSSSITAYIGFDCTADSLHVGSLVQIMMLAWLQKTGHKPLIIMGGGTTKIGDPSGKDQSRQLLGDDAILKNMEGIQSIFKAFLTFGDGASDALMVNNDEWLKGLDYIAFLRDFGRHFSINRMLSFDSVKLRLEREQNLSFLEFNYMILQSYDFAELYKRYGCILQMGGSDQWGNIVSGIDLARRTLSQELYGLTTPLLTTASGAKMGKTADGAVWLNEERVSHFDYWQFWRNIEDADVGRFLRLFTFLPLSEIEKLEVLEGGELNEAKKILATEATKLARGEGAAQETLQKAETIFEQKGNSALPILSFTEGQLFIDLIVHEKLVSSKSETRRLMASGGIKLADIPQKDVALRCSDAMSDVKLSIGKKKHYLLKRT